MLVTQFLSLDKTGLVVFLILSLIVVMFFVSPSAFLALALPAGGLYYFLLIFVTQSISTLIGAEHYLSLNDPISTSLLAATIAGYFYLLSCYIRFVTKRKKKTDLAGVLMISSIIAVFVSPILILFIPATLSSTTGYQPAHVVIYEKSSCLSISDNEYVRWNENTKTCSLMGEFVDQNTIVSIANDVTLELLQGGRITNMGPINNNGTIAINGGNMENIDGNIMNNGEIIFNSGRLYNEGTIHANQYYNGFEMRKAVNPVMPSIKIGYWQTFENYGQFYGYQSNITNLGTIMNYGEIYLNDNSVFVNRGVVSNNKRIEVVGIFENYGEVKNLSQLVILDHVDLEFPTDPFRLGFTTVVNNYGKISNFFGGIYNSAIVNNYGTIESDGEIYNSPQEYEGVINNYGKILNHSGKVINEGKITNYCGSIESHEIEGNLPNYASN